MPSPKNHARLAGDGPLPEVENSIPGLPAMSDEEAGTDDAPRDGGQAGGNDGKPGRAENAAGFVKDDRLSGNRGQR